MEASHTTLNNVGVPIILIHTTLPAPPFNKISKEYDINDPQYQPQYHIHDTVCFVSVQPWNNLHGLMICIKMVAAPPETLNLQKKTHTCK